ncbi:MAG: glycosyltransferase [Chloroflexi bacterium AL-N10]|nr:glycosyltransferase [Chloroflexi bacterium AL-N1]NOK71101.1 glycosyltransferase [Chloroflexi bacterium AL-N10]NOK77349.1 glycosyltransferase [Chloroflexi bacterium AL-N5]
MNPQLPLFSIVIPTHARPKQLSACLTALTRLDYPRDCFEVVVVDDGSPESLEPVVAPFSDYLTITLHRQPRSGPAAARNTGAAKARGQYIAFTDDDCQPRNDWLNVLAAQLTDMPDALVGGHTINAIPDNLCASASQLLVSYLYSYYNTAEDRQTMFFTSNNIALSADYFHAINGFDTSYPRAAAEDRDFCDRWIQHGSPMIYAANAVIYHTHRMTLRSFWRQHLTYGRGAYRFHRGRARRSQGQIKVESTTFYLGLLRFPFSQERPHRTVPLAVLLGLSQGANALGFFWERARLASKMGS